VCLPNTLLKEFTITFIELFSCVTEVTQKWKKLPPLVQGNGPRLLLGKTLATLESNPAST
jgi:hypothetical protein